MTSFQTHFPYPHLPSPPLSDASPYMLQSILDRVRRRPSSSSASSELDEASRLQLLHIAHTAVLNPRHTQIIEQHLASVHSAGRRSRVLDIGAGTGKSTERAYNSYRQDAGTWAIHLANTQPYADVTAVDWDWSWFQPAESCHGNLEFQTIDVSQTLPFPPGSVDLIHIKCLLPSLPQYASLVERLAVVLRPGGMLILVESEVGYVNCQSTHSRTKLTPQSSSQPMSHAMKTWNACLRESMDGKGIQHDLANNLVRFIGSSGVFTSAVYNREAEVRGASALQGDVESLACAGRLHPDLIAANLDRQLAELVAFGYAQEQLWPMMQNVLSELSHGYSPHFQRISAAYATKLGH